MPARRRRAQLSGAARRIVRILPTEFDAARQEASKVRPVPLQVEGDGERRMGPQRPTGLPRRTPRPRRSRALSAAGAPQCDPRRVCDRSTSATGRRRGLRRRRSRRRSIDCAAGCGDPSREILSTKSRNAPGRQSPTAGRLRVHPTASPIAAQQPLPAERGAQRGEQPVGVPERSVGQLFDGNRTRRRQVVAQAPPVVHGVELAAGRPRSRGQPGRVDRQPRHFVRRRRHGEPRRARKSVGLVDHHPRRILAGWQVAQRRLERVGLRPILAKAECPASVVRSLRAATVTPSSARGPRSPILLADDGLTQAVLGAIGRQRRTAAHRPSPREAANAPDPNSGRNIGRRSSPPTPRLIGGVHKHLAGADVVSQDRRRPSAVCSAGACVFREDLGARLGLERVETPQHRRQGRPDGCRLRGRLAQLQTRGPCRPKAVGSMRNPSLRSAPHRSALVGNNSTGSIVRMAPMSRKSCGKCRGPATRANPPPCTDTNSSTSGQTSLGNERGSASSSTSTS